MLSWMVLPPVTFPKAFPQFIPSTRHCHRTISTPVHRVFITGKTHEKCQPSRYHPMHAKYSCMYNVYLIHISYVLL